MNASLNKWIRIPLFNFFITAFIGVILRYKIAFALPFIQQKNLLHGHSHFAFAGWITQILMFFIIVQVVGNNTLPKKYERLLWSNLFTASGMLIAFPIQGYGLFSIIFSTLSIFVSYVFAFHLWKDINQKKSKQPSHLFFKAAVFFNALSSIGAFSLAFMMANKIISQKLSLLAVYFFLHFQYNGWFLFACMGLLVAPIEKYLQNFKQLNTAFWILFTASIPSYFLSALWLKLPVVLNIIVIIAAFAQLIGWHFFIKTIVAKKISFNSVPKIAKMLFLFSAIAASLKFILQAGSLIPSLSTIAFGFRPIVIGYLHLVFLGTISTFIIAYYSSFFLQHIGKKLRTGIIILTAGIILNEMILMIQGLADMYYFFIPNLNIVLLCIAIIMFTGLVFINISFSENKSEVCVES